eukprot:425535_1
MPSQKRVQIKQSMMTGQEIANMFRDRRRTNTRYNYHDDNHDRHDRSRSRGRDRHTVASDRSMDVKSKDVAIPQRRIKHERLNDTVSNTPQSNHSTKSIICMPHQPTHKIEPMPHLQPTESKLSSQSKNIRYDGQILYSKKYKGIILDTIHFLKSTGQPRDIHNIYAVLEKSDACKDVRKMLGSELKRKLDHSLRSMATKNKILINARGQYNPGRQYDRRRKAWHCDEFRKELQTYDTQQVTINITDIANASASGVNKMDEDSKNEMEKDQDVDVIVTKEIKMEKQMETIQTNEMNTASNQSLSDQDEEQQEVIFMDWKKQQEVNGDGVITILQDDYNVKFCPKCGDQFLRTDQDIKNKCGVMTCIKCGDDNNYTYWCWDCSSIIPIEEMKRIDEPTATCKQCRKISRRKRNKCNKPKYTLCP